MIKKSFNSITWMALFNASLLSAEEAKEVFVEPRGTALKRAINRAEAGTVLILREGRYLGTFTVPPQVTLKAEKLHKAEINGFGGENVITLTSNAAVDGLTVKGGRTGIFSRGVDNKIRRCRIHSNRNSGISAIISAPEIQDNLIYRNGSSGIVIWVEDSSYNGSIDHNTIVKNGNHGISVGGDSHITVTNNIVAFNKRLTVKTEGKEPRIEQHHNLYYGNIEFNMRLPKGNWSFDPGFIDIRDNNYNFRDTSRAYYFGEENSRLGTRIYEE
ncbi:MAG: right-handed parallel beta-helix repeat-containing protein [Fibrobacterota bacterium]